MNSDGCVEKEELERVAKELSKLGEVNRDNNCYHDNNEGGQLKNDNNGNDDDDDYYDYDNDTDEDNNPNAEVDEDDDHHDVSQVTEGTT